MSEQTTTTKDTVQDTTAAATTAETTSATPTEEATASAAPATKRKKSGARQVRKGQAHVQSTYNNTIVTITDLNGAVLGWSSSGALGFKGAKKSTPYAASQIINAVWEKVQKHNIKELQIYVSGVGSGRDAAMRALAAKGIDISLIKDVTPIAHNGCRKRKPRRV